MKKRLLSIVLSISMIITFLTSSVTPVFAVEADFITFEEETDSIISEEYTESITSEEDADSIISEEETTTDLPSASSGFGPWETGFDGQLIELEENSPVRFAPFNDDAWLSFIPDDSVSYVFSSTWLDESAGQPDTYATLYDEEGNELLFDDDYYDLQFRIKESLTEGEVYYLLVRMYDFSDATSDFTVTVSKGMSPAAIERINNFPTESPLYIAPVLNDFSADIRYTDGSLDTISCYATDLFGNRLTVSLPDNLDYGTAGDYETTLNFGNLSAYKTVSIRSWDQLNLPVISLGSSSLQAEDQSNNYAIFTAPESGYYSFTFQGLKGNLSLYSENVVDAAYLDNGDIQAAHRLDYSFGNASSVTQTVSGQLAAGEMVLLKYDSTNQTSLSVTAKKHRDVASLTASVSGNAYLDDVLPEFTYKVNYSDGTSETKTLQDVDPNGEFTTASGSLMNLSTAYKTYIAADGYAYPCAGEAELRVSCNNKSISIPLTVAARVLGKYDAEISLNEDSTTISIPSIQAAEEGTGEETAEGASKESGGEAEVQYLVKITPSVSGEYRITDTSNSYTNVAVYDQQDRTIHQNNDTWGNCRKTPLLEAGQSYLLEVSGYDSLPEGSITITKTSPVSDMTLKSAPSSISSVTELMNRIEVEVVYENGETDTVYPIGFYSMDTSVFSFELYKQVKKDSGFTWEACDSYHYSEIEKGGFGSYKYVLKAGGCSEEYIFSYLSEYLPNQLSIEIPERCNGLLEDIHVRATYEFEDTTYESALTDFLDSFGNRLNWKLTTDTGLTIDQQQVEEKNMTILKSGTYFLEVSLGAANASTYFQVLPIEEAFSPVSMGNNALTPVLDVNHSDQYSFIPSESGTYRFDTDMVCCRLYDASGAEIICVNKSSGTGIADLEAGTAYRLEISYMDNPEQTWSLEIASTRKVENLTLRLNKTSFYGGISSIRKCDILISYDDAAGIHHEYTANELDSDGYNLNTGSINEVDGPYANDVLDPGKVYEFRYNLCGRTGKINFLTAEASSASELPNLLENTSLEITPAFHREYQILADKDTTLKLEADAFVYVTIYDQDYQVLYDQKNVSQVEDQEFPLKAGIYYAELYTTAKESGSLLISEDRKELLITEQPESVTAGVKAKVSFHVEAENAASYQWYYSKNGGTSWFKSSASTAKTDTLAVTVASSNASNIYRCKITGIDGSSLLSDAAGINLIPGAKILEQPQSVTTDNSRAAVSFEVKADNVDSYQWQYSKNGGTSWFNTSASGNKTEKMTITLSSTNMNNMYRCKLTGLDGNAVFTQKAGAIILTSQPKDQVYAAGQSVTFSVDARYISSYQWQYSKDQGASWFNSSATGSTTDTMTLVAKSTNKNNLYRCKLTAESGLTGFSDAAGFITGLAILTQPSDVTASVGDTVTLHVEAVNAASYQWYFSKDGKTWSKSGLTGNTTDTLSFKLSETNAGRQYKCKLTGTDGKTLLTDSVTVDK